MGFQEPGLKLQLFRIRPEVVAFAYRRVLSPGHPEHFLKGNPGLPLAEHVFLLDKGNDELRILFRVFPHDIAGSVGGSVVPHDDLKWIFRLLAHHAVQALADVLPVVVRGTEYADKDLLLRVHGFHTPSAGTPFAGSSGAASSALFHSRAGIMIQSTDVTSL